MNKSKSSSYISTPERNRAHSSNHTKTLNKKSPLKGAHPSTPINKQSEILLKLLNTNYRHTYKVRRLFFDRWKLKTLLKSSNAVMTATTVEEVYESDTSYNRKKQNFQKKQILQTGKKFVNVKNLRF